ncbi:MAG: DUF1302 family protein [Parvibaculum sp.]|nr:DUF1302 family protein [Parvibaculum sp.]
MCPTSSRTPRSSTAPAIRSLNCPGPNTANYLQGLKQVSIGIDADYQSTWKGGLSYTNIFGAGFDNPAFDRDFIMASVSYAF